MDEAPVAISLKDSTIQELSSDEKNFDAGVYPNQYTITYALHVPKLSPHDTLLAIHSYIEDQLGEEISVDVSIVFLEQKNSMQTRTVTAVLIQNTHLEEWLSQQKASEISCQWYFPKSFCLQAFYEKFCPKDSQVFLVDYQHSEVSLLYFQNGSLQACRTIPTLSEEKNISLQQQITTSLLAWTEQENPLLIMTGGDDLWRKQLQETLPYQPFIPEENLRPFFQKASCVGASLLTQFSLFDSPPPAIASSKKHPYIASWKTPLLLAAIFSLLTCFFFIFQEKKQEKMLKNQVEKQLEILAQQPWISSLTKPISSIITSYDDTLEEIEKTKLELKKQALFPLKPVLPTFSEMIVWINEQIAKVCSSKDVLEIQKMTYTLVQYPTIDQVQKKYQLRMDIEFFSPDPQVARRLHELLLSTNDFISQKNEVKWNVSGTTYKASFFVLDKTHYSQVQ